MIINNDELRDIIETVNAIIWQYDIGKDEWTYVSPQTINILGYKPKEWKGLVFWVNHIHEEDRSWAKDYCFKCAKKGKDHIFEYRFQKKDGDYIWIRDEVKVIMKGSQPSKLRGFMTEITDLKVREQKVKHLSYRDGLTGIYNRRYFEKTIQELNKTYNRIISIIIGDLDGLKVINDTYGHKVGDYFLKNTVLIINESIRDDDISARIGGDEFGLILMDTNYSQGVRILERINKKLDEHNSSKQLPQDIKISFGLSSCNTKDEDLITTIKEADSKMYFNKFKTKNN